MFRGIHVAYGISFCREPSEIGYNTITIFPVGSRNINITEMEASENFLGNQLFKFFVQKPIKK